jgi:transmembrane sensor
MDIQQSRGRPNNTMTHKPDIAEALLEEAADWLDRLDELSPQEQDEYACWLAASSEHMEAARFMAHHFGINLEQIDDALRALSDTSSDALPDASCEPASESPSVSVIPADITAAQSAIVTAAVVETATVNCLETVRRRKHQGWLEAIPAPLWAVAMLILLVLPVWWWPWSAVVVTPAVQSYVSAGRQQSLQLADGSSVVLNARSSVQVNLQAERRDITLQQGEAFFDVSKDPQRPFYVTTDLGRIRVVGTAFNVDRNSSSLVVEVEHGIVEVEVQHHQYRLLAGDALRVNADKAIQYHSDKVAGWRNGWREVTDEPLPELITHLQRYSERPIELQNVQPGLVFSGRYSQADVEGTLNLIASLFELELQLDDQQIVLRGH